MHVIYMNMYPFIAQSWLLFKKTRPEVNVGEAHCCCTKSLDAGMGKHDISYM